MHLVVYGRRKFGDLPELLRNGLSSSYVVVDCRRLYRDADRNHHHLYRADGNNGKLVLELTKHAKFPSLVDHAKALITPLLRHWEFSR